MVWRQEAVQIPYQLGKKVNNPDINKIDFDNVKDPEEKVFERGTFPDEVVAVFDAASEEKLPKESKIAIEYNLRLKEKG